MEEHLTDCLRRYHPPTDDSADLEGTYVTVVMMDDTSTRHMLIEAWLQDKIGAQLVLAYPNCQGEGNDIVGFSFCLLKGRSKALDPILQWLESTHGCVFANRSFTPTRSQMELFLPFLCKRTDAPLEVTLQAPEVISEKGLDVVTFTLPPMAFKKLLADMEKHRPLTMADAQLPIVKAMYLSIMAATHLDFSSFRIARITSSSGTVGEDGRVKFLHVDILQELLGMIRTMIDESLRTAPQYIHPLTSGMSRDAIAAMEENEDDVHISEVISV